MRPFLGLLLLAATSPAWAQDRPAITPSRDVAIAYRVTSEGQAPAEFRVSWLAARGLLRVDLPGGESWMVLDQSAGRAFLVTEAQRQIMDTPTSGLPTGLVPDADARFTREGRARVAQTDCTNWRMEARTQAARVCVTSDGVVLRSESLDGPRSGLMEATALAFAAQDPRRFEQPAGYQRFQLPPGIGGAPRGTALPPPGLTTPTR